MVKLKNIACQIRSIVDVDLSVKVQVGIVCFGCRGKYRVVYVTPEYIEGDGCELFKQLQSNVGMLRN